MIIHLYPLWLVEKFIAEPCNRNAAADRGHTNQSIMKGPEGFSMYDSLMNILTNIGLKKKEERDKEREREIKIDREG